MKIKYKEKLIEKQAVICSAGMSTNRKHVLHFLYKSIEWCRPLESEIDELQSELTSLPHADPANARGKIAEVAKKK